MESIGKAIKKIRKAACFTQEELANKIGIGRSSIAQYENDIHIPGIEKLQDIINVSNATPLDLFPNSEKFKEKIVNEEISKNPAKYSNSLNSISINGIPQDLKDFINDFLLLDEKDQEMYYYEIKAKVLRKKKVNIN